MPSFASILFGGTDQAGAEDLAAPDAITDLHLDHIRDALFAPYSDFYLGEFFDAPLRDIDTVRYRQEVFIDLGRAEITDPVERFTEGIRETLRCLQQVHRLPHRYQRDRWHLDAADAYCHAITTLHNELAASNPTARGLRELTDYLAQYLNNPELRQFAEQTRSLIEEFREIRYCVHIDGQDVQVQRFHDQPDYTGEVEETFARFRHAPSGSEATGTEAWTDMNHIDEQVLDCVARLYPDSFRRLDDFRTQHPQFINPTITRFNREVHFYLAYRRFMTRFTEAGLRFCIPQITPRFDGIDVANAFDLALATTLVEQKTPLVCNDFRLSGPERILIVTGPNSGGKTTFARMFGQLSYLAALGCPVPGTHAKLLLPDYLFTHFERQETVASLRGKLDDELVRIHEILTAATERSVIVMNESFGSTTADDALLIGTDVLKQIIDLGAITVYVTFLDELASFSDATVSMVGDVTPEDPSLRTYRITRRPADGLAYADAIAAKYGLTYDAVSRSVTR